MFGQDYLHVWPGLPPCMARITYMFGQDYLHVWPGLPTCVARITHMCGQDYLQVWPGLPTCVAKITYKCDQDYLHVWPGLPTYMARITYMCGQYLTLHHLSVFSPNHHGPRTPHLNKNSLLSYTSYVEIVGNLNSHAIRDVDNIKVAVSRNITSQSSKNSTPRSVRYRGVDIF